MIQIIHIPRVFLGIPVNTGIELNDSVLRKFFMFRIKNDTSSTFAQTIYNQYVPKYNKLTFLEFQSDDINQK